MKIPFSFNPLGASKDSGGGMPTSGLVFYAPLVTDDHDAFGRTMLTYGSGVTYNNTINGISCMYQNNASLIYTEDKGKIPTGNHDFSLSIWFSKNPSWSGHGMIFSFGSRATAEELYIVYNTYGRLVQL